MHKQRYHNEHPWICGSALTMINILPILFPLLFVFFLLNLMTFQFSGGIQRSHVSSSLQWSLSPVFVAHPSFSALAVPEYLFPPVTALFPVFKCPCFFSPPFKKRSIYLFLGVGRGRGRESLR